MAVLDVAHSSVRFKQAWKFAKFTVFATELSSACTPSETPGLAALVCVLAESAGHLRGESVFIFGDE